MINSINMTRCGICPFWKVSCGKNLNLFCANFLFYWENFHCCKLPNIELIIESSGHTELLLSANINIENFDVNNAAERRCDLWFSERNQSFVGLPLTTDNMSS